jgi:hypothetical protein
VTNLVRILLVLVALEMFPSVVSAAERVIAVPISLRGNSPIVMVGIDGHDVPLIFDSGSSATVSLSQAVLDLVHATPTGETSRGMDAKGNVITYPKYRIPRIQIGEAVFLDVVAERDVHDPSYQATDLGQQGFLGTGLLKPYRVVLDYRHRLLSLIPGADGEDQGRACAGTSVPFATQWHGEPVTEIETDLGILTVWWDTGAPAMVLSRRFVQARQWTGSGDRLNTKGLLIGGKSYGPASFMIWDMSLPPGFDGFIGYQFFARHRVCMDFPNQRLVIAQGPIVSPGSMSRNAAPAVVAPVRSISSRE